ncbi:hypothetical protein FIBSPDRAFT_60576 [Athelia psychrophila]|uniref:F-box domain-containing protein n=1 Tax=Athelia psychrophila TaxID=1759441 RepID=A0A166F5G7_9AGAM|nr:hypothetical protein FIBSPDRAFT_60576 [Fibularhizoctonia sp. CBS 109695]
MEDPNAHQLRDSEKQDACHISTIPAETLTSIFLACVQDRMQKNGCCDPISETSPPLVFLSVCKRWRQLAMSQPGLWRILRVHTMHLNHIRMMSRWLQFANQQPLSICLDAGYADGIADLALDVILEHQSSWSEVELRWRSPNVLPLFGNLFTPHHAPLLQKFTIVTEFEDFSDAESPLDARLGRMLAGSSQIHSFEWKTDQLYDTMEPVHLSTIPFGSLRQLKLGCSMAFSCCLEVLCHTPLIECCEFTYVQNVHEHSFSGPICLPHLHSLCIKTDSNMENFLDTLTLPSLQRIEVVFRISSGDKDSEDELAGDFGPWPHAEFLSLLQRSACPLEELTLVAPVAEDALLEYLHLASLTMKTISLRGKLGWASIGQRALKLLTILPNSTEGILCPNIRKIRFDNCIIGPLPQNSMADMIQSRMLYCAHNRSRESPLEVYLSAPVDFVDEEDWRRLTVSKRRSAGKARIHLVELPCLL